MQWKTWVPFSHATTILTIVELQQQQRAIYVLSQSLAENYYKKSAAGGSDFLSPDARELTSSALLPLLNVLQQPTASFFHEIVGTREKLSRYVSF